MIKLDADDRPPFLVLQRRRAMEGESRPTASGRTGASSSRARNCSSSRTLRGRLSCRTKPTSRSGARRLEEEGGCCCPRWRRFNRTRSLASRTASPSPTQPTKRCESLELAGLGLCEDTNASLSLRFCSTRMHFTSSCRTADSTSSRPPTKTSSASGCRTSTTQRRSRRRRFACEGWA